MGLIKYFFCILFCLINLSISIFAIGNRSIDSSIPGIIQNNLTLKQDLIINTSLLSDGDEITKCKPGISIQDNPDYYERSISISPEYQEVIYGINPKITIKLDSGENIEKTNLVFIKIKVLFDREFINALNVELGDSLKEGFRFSYDRAIINNIYGEIDIGIESMRSRIFNNACELCNIEFKVIKPFMFGRIANINAIVSTMGNECVKISTDNSGKIKIKSLDNPIGEHLKIIIPNPVGRDGALVQYSIDFEGMTEIKVYNNIGQLVLTPVSEIKASGDNEFHLDAVNLASGQYTLVIKQWYFTEIAWFVVVR